MNDDTVGTWVIANETAHMSEELALTKEYSAAAVAHSVGATASAAEDLPEIVGTVAS